MEGGIEKKKFEDMKRALEERHYEIIKSIGKGAFGEVMLARNSTSNIEI
jgi:serine/threonine protein kinase